MNGVSEKPGERYYLGAWKRKTMEHRYVRRKNKKLLCNDGVIRRFCDGVDDKKVWGQDRCLPVICSECRYDFNFFTIYERTIETLKSHTCEIKK